MDFVLRAEVSQIRQHLHEAGVVEAVVGVVALARSRVHPPAVAASSVRELARRRKGHGVVISTCEIRRRGHRLGRWASRARGC